MACLKCVGKVDSVRQRFSSVVIGGSRASMQDFSNRVGSMSSGHVESDEERIIFFTSSMVAGARLVMSGGGTVGWMCGEGKVPKIVERSVVILSEKN